MTAAIRYLFGETPAPTQWTVKNGNASATIQKTGKNIGVVEAVSNQWSRTKGAADLFGNIAKALTLACTVVPVRFVRWTDHLASSFGQGKSILAVPYWLSTLRKFFSPAPDESLATRARNGTEAVSIGGYFAIQVAPPGSVWTKAVGGVASVLKTAVDAFDFTTELGHYHEYNQLLADTKGAVSEEAKQGLAYKMKETACKILKYFLGTLSGLVAASVFLFHVTLSPFVATAAIVASLGSGIFSFAADHLGERSPWNVSVKTVAVEA